MRLQRLDAVRALLARFPLSIILLAGRIGVGATFFSADEAEEETKLAPVVAAGLKWFPSGGNVGARIQARYNPTHLDDAGGDFCDPFGFCQSWLQQFQFLGGVSIRF